MERHIKRDEIYCKKALGNFYQSRLDTQITIIFFYIFFQPSIKLNGKSINFEDKKINKSNFYKNKNESSDSQNGVIHSRLLLLLKHHLIF